MPADDSNDKVTLGKVNATPSPVVKVEEAKPEVEAPNPLKHQGIGGSYYVGADGVSVKHPTRD